MLALEHVSVINDAKGTKEYRNREKESDNSAVIKQSPSSSSRDIDNNKSWSSAGTKAPTQVEDGMMILTLQTSVN